MDLSYVLTGAVRQHLPEGLDVSVRLEEVGEGRLAGDRWEWAGRPRWRLSACATLASSGPPTVAELLSPAWEARLEWTADDLAGLPDPRAVAAALASRRGAAGVPTLESEIARLSAASPEFRAGVEAERVMLGRTGKDD